MSKQQRLSAEKKQRIARMAGKMTQPAIAERFGISTRTVARILDDCPDCDECGAPTVPGSPLCQACAGQHCEVWAHGVKVEPW